MECFRDNFDNGVILGGRYETVSPLNHGSFGMVFVAKDLKLNKTVAVKCLTKRNAANEAGFEFAIDDKSEELALHRHLGSQPNIVNLLDSFETEAHIYLVLEFCEQGDLYEAIRVGHGPLETEHVRRFMLELVDAVSYIHSRGIYHRDIKPENIFIAQDGTMKLGDFGLATTERWTFETTVGSDRYMSPEQYDSAGAGYSPAQADVWAVGICLLNVLFSRNPFTTPSESDLLFLDFSRDKQSLFDVFPSMSQDTYEIIVECMNMDPSKRSLVGARDALRRAISFTTEDEALDDFCTADHCVGASANREPLRTPSLQSPQVDAGAFPWARALQASPQKPVRQLSVIPDDESYTEDLFSKSGATAADWFSGTAQTPSMSSVLDSSFGASMHSLAISRPATRARISGTTGHLMAGSLPISMTKSKPTSAMSLVFGRKDTVSKSWSDMWDEENEEEEEERAREALKVLNGRTWSHDSTTKDNNTPREGISPLARAVAIDIKQDVSCIDSTISNDIDEDLVADGFFFHDVPAAQVQAHSPSRYSPPSKRNGVDKWAVLGERRRAHTGTSSTPYTPEKSFKPSTTAGKEFGIDLPAHGTSDLFGHLAQNRSTLNQSSNHSLYTQAFSPTRWNRNTSKERPAKECPWNKGRERDLVWRKEKRHDIVGDVEWVGGWQDAHS